MKVTNRPSLNRVFEISLVENQPVLIVSNFNLLPDVDMVKKECNFINFATVENFNESLKIEVVEVSYNQTSAHLEAWEDVFERVERAKKVVVSDTICESSNALLKTAYERLSLTELHKNVIIKTAKNIAKLENSNKILVQHIVEAIQYQYCEYEENVQAIEMQIEYLQNKLKELKIAT